VITLSFNERVVALRAARKAATAAPMPAVVKSHTPNLALWNLFPTKETTPPISPGATQYEALLKDPQFIARLAIQRIETAVDRVCAHAGLKPAPLSDESKRVIANAQAAGLGCFDRSRTQH
jgi:hypothetical protein